MDLGFRVQFTVYTFTNSDFFSILECFYPFMCPLWSLS